MIDSSAPSGRKAIFLDIDGTYAERGVVPPAHRDAVRAAREAGHVVMLCTGRPLSLIFDQMTEAGFDGIVAAAGAHITVDGRTLLDQRFPAALAARTITALDAYKAVYWLETPEATFARQSTLDRVGDHLPAHMKHSPDGGRARAQVLQHLTVVEDLSTVDVGKITIMHSEVPLAQIASELGPEVGAIASSIPGMGDRAGELYMAEVNKATGIATVIAFLGVDRSDVIAFGDGPNDIEMLEFAEVGVAIDGAAPELIAVADRTCAGPEQSGLAAAFAELGLLGLQPVSVRSQRVAREPRRGPLTT